MQTTRLNLFLRNFTLLSGLFALLAGTAQARSSHWPDSTIPQCDGSATGTLQSCINYGISNAPDFSASIEIVGSASNPGLRVIDEDISVTMGLNTSFQLTASPGVDAVFANGRSVSVTTHQEGIASINISGLTFNAGNLQVMLNADGTGHSSPSTSLALDNNRFNGVTSHQCAIKITSQLRSTSTRISVTDNTIESNLGGTSDRGGICFDHGHQNDQTILIANNRIQSRTGDFAVGIDIGRNTAQYPGHYSIRGLLQITRNQLIGGESRGSGIRLSQVPTAGQLLTQVDNNMVTGWRSPSGATGAGIYLGVYNAPATSELSGVGVYNNTVVANANGIWVEHTQTTASDNTPLIGPLSLRLVNNLISNNIGEGLHVASSSGDTVTGSNNLLWGNGTDTVPTTFINSISNNPQLISSIYPRPADGSPAVDAGAVLPTAVFLTSDFDVDGEKRLVSSNLDIGAYETNGDRAGQQVVYTDSDTNVVLTNLGALNREDVIVATPILNSIPTSLNQPVVGVYFSSGDGANFSLFNEDQTTFLRGQRFSVLSPYLGKDWFLHRSTADTSGSNQLNHPSLNSNPFAIAVALHRFDDPNNTVSSQYYNRVIGLTYNGLENSWYIANESPSVAMNGDLFFNIVIAPSNSPNAFIQMTDAIASDRKRLDHPLLDNNPCAAPIVGYARTISSSAQPAGSTLAITYLAGTQGAPGHWYAVAASPNPAQGNATRFNPRQGLNVIIDGAQANSCDALQGTLFSDGFE